MVGIEVDQGPARRCGKGLSVGMAGRSRQRLVERCQEFEDLGHRCRCRCRCR